jgi:predicted enzyme related to lactoylglutathione lyase
MSRIRIPVVSGSDIPPGRVVFAGDVEEGDSMPRPIHFEIHGDDPVAATEFYSAVFDWKVEQWGDQPYWLYTTGEGEPGIDGATAPSEDHGQKVVLTVQVGDLAESVEKARAAGGTVLLENSPIPGVGTLAQVLDPNGVLVGLLQPAAAE